MLGVISRDILEVLFAGTFKEILGQVLEEFLHKLLKDTFSVEYLAIDSNQCLDKKSGAFLKDLHDKFLFKKYVLQNC